MENDYQIDGMLTQGIFVGAVSDNFDERIGQKIGRNESIPAYPSDSGIQKRRWLR